MRASFLAIGITLVIAGAVPAQRPETRPVRAAESRPKEKGTADLLKRLLAEHFEARAKNTKESLARADEIDRRLPDDDWSKVDVPATTLEFAAAQEQKARDRKIEGWDFDRLPPSIVGLTTTGKWAAFVEQRLDALTQHGGAINWKSPKAWRNASGEMVQTRAFEKVASHLSKILAKNLAGVPRDDLKRIWDAYLRIYEHYDFDTVHRSTQYDYLPAGFYLQWAGWLGDRRSWKVATAIADAWFSNPRETQLPNFDQAVRAIDSFNNQLEPDEEPRRDALIRRIKADPKTPESVRANIHSV